MSAKDSNNIHELLMAARTLEDYLWGENNEEWGLEEWRRMFRKRIAKLDMLDLTNPHWKVEFRKRVMQLGSVAVACMTAIDSACLNTVENPPQLMSNLPDYAKINENIGMALRELRACTGVDDLRPVSSAIRFLEEVYRK